LEFLQIHQKLRYEHLCCEPSFTCFELSYQCSITMNFALDQRSNISCTSSIFFVFVLTLLNRQILSSKSRLCIEQQSATIDLHFSAWPQSRWRPRHWQEKRREREQVEGKQNEGDHLRSARKRRREESFLHREQSGRWNWKFGPLDGRSRIVIIVGRTERAVGALAEHMFDLYILSSKTVSW
jgi:hypothetical protein